MNRVIICLLLAVGLSSSPRPLCAVAELPNILWIVAEDINPHLGCYGDTNATTPNIDRLASQGLRFTKCWSSAPVCAPARTALITGVYPVSTGSEHMRSLVRMPAFMRMYPQLLRDKGYCCVNKAKEDYNLDKPGKVWDESSTKAHYRHRKPGQPFFAAFNIETSHESQIRTRPHTLQHDPTSMRLPAYHPDTPEVRHDWAQYYDKIKEMDEIAGRHLRELADLGLADDTIVFFYGDNGSGMPRSKRWPYNSGLNVPLIIRVPEKFRHLAPEGYVPGGTSPRLVNFVDFAPTLLSIAGTVTPRWMQGRAFMGRFPTTAPRYSFGFRGRMDERYDFVRSVRTSRYIYIRNYLPHLIYGQHLAYMWETPTTRVWEKLYQEGKLKPPQTYFWETKPTEELYDLETDPDEVRNLASSPEHQHVMIELRRVLHDHILQTRDLGFLPEPEMHERSAGTTPYEMGHDPQGYYLERILSMADLASLLNPDAVPELVDGLKDNDSAVRYWAALGLAMRGPQAVAAARQPLTAALKDPSPSVRVAAAQGLGRYGSEADLAAALAVLGELAPVDRNGPYVSMLALNTVSLLGSKAAPLKETIGSMPVTDPALPDRVNGWVGRLVTQITNSLAPAR